jgi:hypothetical protein
MLATTPRSNESNLLVTAPSSEPPKSDAFYKRWPFWVVTGGVVVGGVIAAVLLGSRGNNLNMPSPPLGTKEY